MLLVLDHLQLRPEPTLQQLQPEQQYRVQPSRLWVVERNTDQRLVGLRRSELDRPIFRIAKYR
jgi:hypothetical protein